MCMKTENFKNDPILYPRNLSALNFNESIAEKIDLVCAPLLQSLRITHFGYIKLFNNGTMLRMANNREWTKKYFEQEYYNDDEFYNMKDVAKEKSKFLLLTGEPQGAHLTSLCKDFNIWNALTIYEKFNDYSDIWFFGTSQQNTEAINFYLNNINVLKKFTSFFKDKFNNELKNINIENLIFSNIAIETNDIKENKNIKSFFDKINIKYFKISNDLSISKKEFECLSFLIQGKTAKEIARLTGGSYRTIEFHLQNLKKKANCQKQSHLIEFLLKNRIFCSLLDKF